MSFFFNDTATAEIYTLSLHDALPIALGEAEPLLVPHAAPFLSCLKPLEVDRRRQDDHRALAQAGHRNRFAAKRSEEHTSELQSRQYLVCRLLLEKKQKTLMYTLTPPT